MSSPWAIALAAYCVASIGLCALLVGRPSACVHLWRMTRWPWLAAVSGGLLFLLMAWLRAGRAWPADAATWAAAATVATAAIAATAWLFSQVGAALSDDAPAPPFDD